MHTIRFPVLFARHAPISSRISSRCQSYLLQNLQRTIRNASTARAPPSSTYRAGTSGSFVARPDLVRFMNKPMVLVETSYPFLYRLGWYSLAGFCFTYVGANAWGILFSPRGEPPRFAKLANYAIDGIMLVLGGIAFLRTTRIVARVTSIPIGKNSSTGQRGLMLRIETFRALPGAQHKVTQVPADTVSTSGYLGVPGYTKSTLFPPTREELIAERHWINKQRRKEYQDSGGSFALPFREASYWIGRFVGRSFNGLKDAFEDDAFVHLKASGKNGTWKIDKEIIWGLDNGHAFDKVVKVEPV